jgi:hypothetical protein
MRTPTKILLHFPAENEIKVDLAALKSSLAELLCVDEDMIDLVSHQVFLLESIHGHSMSLPLRASSY